MRRLSKIWGFILTISILAGSLVTATPVAAGNLSWTTETTPSSTGNVMTTSTGPWIMDGTPDGETLFAYDGTILYKSINAGLSWAATAVTGLNGTMVGIAVSPDYATNPVIVAANPSSIYYSVNGGSSFLSLSTSGLSGSILSIDVSPYWTGNIGILVGTTDGAFLALASTSGFAGAFQNVVTLTGGGTLSGPVYGVAFSPNHRIDAMMFFYSGDGTVSNKFANTAINGQFGKAILAGAPAATASFAFPADYAREGNNRFFVGVADGDVYRVSEGVGVSSALDLNASGTSATDVKSLSFKGNIADGYLYVGLGNAASVLRATATTATTVTFTDSTRMSGTNNTVVFASPASGDANVYAITAGTGAAFQVSTDNAATFTLKSLIAAGSMTPAIMSLAMVDINTRYMILGISNGVLFKSTDAGSTWEGIYWPPSGNITNVYLSPSFATDSTLFLTGDNTVIRRSSNGGISFSTLLNANLTNTSAFAVVDANTFFVGATNSIYKSGISTTAHVAGTVTSLVAIDANTIVAGTSSGNVYLSSNGGTSYTLLGAAAVGSGNTYVMPDAGYATNKIIYAANAGGFFTWTVNTSTTWTPVAGSPTNVTGLTIGTDGTIYASSPTGVLRSLDAYTALPGFGSTAIMTPATVVKVLATGTLTVPNNTLFVVTGGNVLRSFQDTLVVAPEPITPVAGSTVSQNPTFSWEPLTVPSGYLVYYQVQYTPADYYNIHVWTNTIYPAAGLTSTNSIDTLVPGRTYYWRVLANGVTIGPSAYSMKSKTSPSVAFNVSSDETPVAASDSYNTSEDTLLNVPAPGVLSNDGHAVGTNLTAILVTNVTHGSLAFNGNGSFTYTPALNYNGSDSFTYVANDGSADSNVATVSITVNPINESPVAVDDNYNTNKNTTLNISTPGVLGNDTDIDSNNLYAIDVTDPTHGTLTLNTSGSFSYSPVNNYTGTDTFTYKANDGSTDSNVATVTITVNATNNTPVASNDTYSTNEDSSLDIAASGILANDIDADPGTTLTATLALDTSFGNLSLNADGSFSYTPDADYNGSDTFTYQARDGIANSNTATVTITVNSVNDAPAFTKGNNQIVGEGAGSQKITGWATNISPGPGNETIQALNFIVNNDNNNLFSSQPVISSTGTLTYTPAANTHGSAIVSVRLHDNGGTANGGIDTSAPQTFTITVNPPGNTQPEADSKNINTDQATAQTITLTGSDVETVELTFSLNTLPAHGSLSPIINNPGTTGTPNSDNASITYTPYADFSGNDSFTYTVSDGIVSSSPATVSIIVEAPDNTPPVAGNDNYNTGVDSPLNISAPGVLANDSDADDNPITSIKVTDPAHGVLELQADGSFTYSPSANYSGTDSFTYKANDSKADSNIATVSVTINSPQPEPQPLPPSDGGDTGGGGGSGGSGDKQFLGQYIDPAQPGTFAMNASLKTWDGLLRLTLPAGTSAKTVEGWGLSYIVLQPIPVTENKLAAPDKGNIVGLTYKLEPEGATFAPPITLNLLYKDEQIPAGVNEKDLVIGYWDTTKNQWVVLAGCVVDAANNTITAPLRHFSTYAVLYIPPKVTPASFSLSSLAISPAMVKVGETVSISTTVTNSGGSTGSYSLVLKVNGSQVETKEISLDPGKSQTVQFSAKRDAPGEYTADINGNSGKFQVAQPTTTTTTTTSTTPTDTIKPTQTTTLTTTPVQTTTTTTTSTQTTSSPDQDNASASKWIAAGIILLAGLAIGGVLLLLRKRKV
jgi:VCBS repeat-containing protein